MPIKLMPALSGNPEWGDIAGKIEYQADLKTILDSKSAEIHNHSLSELSEKSYTNLDDLPNLNDYFLKSDSQDLLPSFILDGVDDYLEITTSVEAKPNGDFSMIACVGLQSTDYFRVIAAKGIRASFTGWTLFASYNSIGISIGDGSKYLSASHSLVIDLGKIYTIAISFNNTSKELLFSINGNLEVFDLTSLGTPVGNNNSLLIGKNPANSSFTDLMIHSLIFYSNCFTAEDLSVINKNINQRNIFRIMAYSDLKLALLPNSFGKYYWFDAAGCERHSTVNGGLLPAYYPENIIIPLVGITENISLGDAVPAGYCIEFFSLLNHHTSSLTVTLKSDNVVVVDSQIVNPDEEINLSINHLPSLHVDSDLTIEFDETTVEADLYIFIRKVAKFV